MDRKTFVICPASNMYIVNSCNAKHTLYNDINDILNYIIGNKYRPIIAECRADDGTAFPPFVFIFGKNIIRKIGKETAEMLFQFHRGHGDDMLAVPQP